MEAIVWFLGVRGPYYCLVFEPPNRLNFSYGAGALQGFSYSAVTNNRIRGYQLVRIFSLGNESKNPEEFEIWQDTLKEMRQNTLIQEAQK